MKKIDIDIAIDSFAAETIDIAIAIENFWGDNWYCHWPKNSTIAQVWYIHPSISKFLTIKSKLHWPQNVDINVQILEPMSIYRHKHVSKFVLGGS